jgi:uncharacterized protein involved in exopolysaccharide biosynthesis
MFQHPKGFSPSVPISVPDNPVRPDVAAVRAAGSTVVARLAPVGDLAFIWRRKGLIACCTVAMMVAGLSADFFIAPRYRAASQILIGPTDLNVVDKALLPAAQSADASVIQVESETRVLTSDRVLSRVVEREQLIGDPEFGPGGKSLMSRLRTALGLGTGAEPKAGDPQLGALRALQKKVTAKRTERTFVVDLIVETGDPEKSARIANDIAQAYLDEQTASRAEASRRASDSLASRLNELRERVRRAEEQVETYKREHSIVGGAQGRLVDEQQLTELNNQLTLAKGRTAEAKARYDQILRLQRSGIDPGSTSEAVQSQTIGRLRELYATAARQEANLSAELGPRHPWVVDARAQTRNARQQITDELTRVTEATRTDYERSLVNENSLASSLDALKRRSMDTSLAFVKLRELERESEASRAVYEAFLVRTRQMREQERLDTTNVRILSDAQPPAERAWPPRRLIMLLAGLIAGIVGGVGLAFLLDLLRGHSRLPVQDTRKAA